MKKFISVILLCLILFSGCSDNLTFKETRDFYTQNEKSLKEIVNIFEKYPIVIHIENLEFNREKKMKDVNDKYFEIVLKKKGESKNSYFYLKKDFVFQDSNVIAMKNIFAIDENDISFLCQKLLDLNVKYLKYDTPGTLFVSNLIYKKNGFTDEKQKENLIATDWYYYYKKAQ